MINKSLPSLNDDADKLISFIKELKDFFSEPKLILTKSTLNQLIKEPFKKVDKDFGKIISFTKNDISETQYLFDETNIKKGFTYLFKRLFQLFQLNILKM